MFKKWRRFQIRNGSRHDVESQNLGPPIYPKRDNPFKVTQKLVMEKLKSIENERNKSKENETIELESDDDSDSCVSISDTSSEEEVDLANTLTTRASQKKNTPQKSPTSVFNQKKNAKNFKKYQKQNIEIPKSFQRRNKQLMKRKTKKRFFTSK